MKIILREFTNGNTSASMEGISISNSGSTLVSEKSIEVIDNIAKSYFKNPDMYIVDFEKGEIRAKSNTA